jgi:hypothetical protein
VYVNTNSLLPILDPIAVVLVAIMALPNSCAMFQSLLPIADVNLVVEPSELALTFPVSAHIAAFVNTISS